mgnify:FL=1
MLSFIDTKTQLETGVRRYSRHPYSKGMFVTLSNHKMSSVELLGTFKRQYQSVLGALGIKASRTDIKQVKGIPSRSTINTLLENGLPIAIACIHDNPTEDSDLMLYQHSHMLYHNLAQYMPSDPVSLPGTVNMIRRRHGRYIGKKHKRDGVDIRPVGSYKHYQEHDLDDMDFYDYLHTPLNSPRKDCLINYMAHNRHNPDVDYGLHCLYYDEDYIPIRLTNRTITTTR